MDTTKKHVCFITDSLFNSAGIEHSLSVIASALSDDYKVTVLTAFQKGRPLFYPISKNISYFDLNVNNKLKQEPWNNSVKKDFQKKLYNFLKQNPQDIVISVGGLSQFCLYKIKDRSKKIFWFKFEINIYKVWTANFNCLKRTLLSKIQKYRMIYYARKYDRIVVLTDSDKRQWDKYTHKAIRIYNPITLDRSPKISDCSNKNVIAVGRLERVKGFDLLITAWSEINKKHPDWKLTIFGEGSERHTLEKIISDLKLQYVVSLPGKTKDIIKQYANSSIFVLSSREEGFGNVLVEAEACGLPIISFDCPYGPREIINDNINGFLVPTENISKLTSRINELINNEQLRKEMGQQSLLAAKKFLLKNIKKEWINNFETL